MCCLAACGGPTPSEAAQKAEEAKARAKAAEERLEAVEKELERAESGTTTAPTTPKGDKVVHWNYRESSEEGPEHWGALTPEYQVCGTGKRQTPIDLRESEATAVDLKNILFVYRPVDGTALNNGHTLQVNVTPGCSIVIDDVQYDLAQFHYHTPSEHAVDGKRFPIEWHFVHKDSSGKLAVIGVFAKKGHDNSVLAPALADMPRRKDESVSVGKLDLGPVFPTDRMAYRYEGSLTTPPCSEGVRWTVFASPTQMGPKQLNSLQYLVGKNARPLEPRNGRTIIFDDISS